MRFRIDGALQSVGVFPPGIGSDVVTRLKVLAGLLTYRSETPQEGRLAADDGDESLEMRVSTFPTLHGERAVIRIFGSHEQLRHLQDLRLPEPILPSLEASPDSSSGTLAISSRRACSLPR